MHVECTVYYTDHALLCEHVLYMDHVHLKGDSLPILEQSPKVIPYQLKLRVELASYNNYYTHNYYRLFCFVLNLITL